MTTFESLPTSYKVSKVCPAIRRLSRRKITVQDEWKNKFTTISSFWDANAPIEVLEEFKYEVSTVMNRAKLKILAQMGKKAMLKSYIYEWRKFYAHCNAEYAKKQGSFQKFMLDTWAETVTFNIKQRLQTNTVDVINAERAGKEIDSRILIVLRESYINLCTNSDDKLFFYREYFEKPYFKAMKTFYQSQVLKHLESNNVANYMQFISKKIKEEEEKAVKYLHPSAPRDIVMQSCVNVLVDAFKEVVFTKCIQLMKEKESEKLCDIVRVFGHNPEQVNSLIDAIEENIINASLLNLVAAASVCGSVTTPLILF